MLKYQAVMLEGPRYPCGTKGQDRTIRSAGFLHFGPSPMELTAACLIEKPDLFKRELKHYLIQQQS